MSDKQLIEMTAELWVENGGDAEGLDWSYTKLKAEILRLTTEDKEIKL